MENFDAYPPKAVRVNGHEVPTYQTIFEKEIQLMKYIRKSNLLKTISILLSLTAIAISILTLLLK